MQLTVNKNIQKIVSQTGQKQADIAARCGMSKAVFSNICRCKRKVYADEVIPIALAMGVTIEDLFAEAAKPEGVAG